MNTNAIDDLATKIAAEINKAVFSQGMFSMFDEPKESPIKRLLVDFANEIKRQAIEP